MLKPNKVVYLNFSNFEQNCDKLKHKCISKLWQAKVMYINTYLSLAQVET